MLDLCQTFTRTIVHIYDNMKSYTIVMLLGNIGAYVVDRVFYRCTKKWLEEPYEEKVWYECNFLTDKGLRNAELLEMDKLVPVTKPIVDFVEAADVSLDICFYVITANNVVESILKANRRKVAVRVIVDYNTGLLNNEHTRKFLKAGIMVYAMKKNQNASIMHHKFCIRDGRVLLQASMNLTQNTAKGSFDNILMTNDAELVRSFSDLFENLVDRFKFVPDDKDPRHRSRSLDGTNPKPVSKNKPKPVSKPQHRPGFTKKDSDDGFESARNRRGASQPNLRNDKKNRRNYRDDGNKKRYKKP